MRKEGLFMGLAGLLLLVGCIAYFQMKKKPHVVASTTLQAGSDTELSQEEVVLQTSKGTIRYRFYQQGAPQTVSRMKELIQKGFYNGLTFHRVVPGFVVQGGDPLGTGMGGSGQKLKAEFNEHPHVEGTLAMARAGDPDSADSQFYISLGTHPHLDRQYTVFGQVVSGMEVIHQIQQGDVMTQVTLSAGEGKGP